MTTTNNEDTLAVAQEASAALPTPPAHGDQASAAPVPGTTERDSTPQDASSELTKGASGEGQKPKTKRPARSRESLSKDGYVFFNPGSLASIKVTMDVPIGSDLGQNAIDTYVPQLEDIIPRLYNFVENRLKYGVRHLRSAELGNLIDARIERSFAFVDHQKTIESLESRLQAAGVDYTPLFSQRVVTVQFSSPHTRRFIEGVQMQDRLVTLSHLAWLTGLVENSVNRETFFRATSRIGAAFNRVNTMMKATQKGINPLVNSGRRDGKTMEELSPQAEGTIKEKTKPQQGHNETAQPALA